MISFKLAQTETSLTTSDAPSTETTRRSDRIKEKTNQYFPESPIERFLSEQGQEALSSESSQKSGDSEYISLSQGQRNLISVLNALGIFQVDLSQVKGSKTSLMNLVKDVGENFAEKLTSALQLNPSFLKQHETSMSKDFADILSNLRTEYEKQHSSTKKMEILSLLPGDWKYAKIAEYFPVTDYIYRKFISFERNIGKGIIIS